MSLLQDQSSVVADSSSHAPSIGKGAMAGAPSMVADPTA